MSNLSLILSKVDSLQKEINQCRPLSKQNLEKFKEYFKVGLIYSSNAIEGNSLTESETKIILEDGITIGGKSIREHLEVIGHSEAYEYLFKLAKNRTITEEDIVALHNLIYHHIDAEKSGRYRREQVFITGTEYLPPNQKEIPKLMKDFADSIKNLDETNHPVKYAALLHKEIVDIHPFVDGNGRTARLIMNLALLQKGYCVTIIPPILRDKYITTIKAYQTGQKNMEPFFEFIAEMVYESQRDYLRLLKALN